MTTFIGPDILPSPVPGSRGCSENVGSFSILLGRVLQESLLSSETEHLPQTRESIGIRTSPEITSQFDSAKGFAQPPPPISSRSEEHASELQSLTNLVCRLL